MSGLTTGTFGPGAGWPGDKTDTEGTFRGIGNPLGDKPADGYAADVFESGSEAAAGRDRYCGGARRGRIADEVERVTGIEPAWPVWKTGALPLSYTRVRAAPSGFERFVVRATTLRDVRPRPKTAPRCRGVLEAPRTMV